MSYQHIYSRFARRRPTNLRTGYVSRPGFIVSRSAHTAKDVIRRAKSDKSIKLFGLPSHDQIATVTALPGSSA
jgi:hypothetical protein